MRWISSRNGQRPDAIPGSVVAVRPRFVADGSWGEALRASLAAPLVSLATASLTASARTDSPEDLHRRERMFARWAEWLGQLRVDVDGAGRIDPHDRYVVVALHEGLADVLGLLRLPLGLRFAARDELFDWPGVGRYLSAARHVQVDTTPTRHSTLRLLNQVSEVFESGDSLVVFAQGSILGVEVAFQPGAMILARRFQRPLLPVVLTGSHRVWEHPYGSTLRFGQKISVTVLDPIPPVEMSAASFRALEREMKRVALGEAMAPVRRYRPERDGWWDGYPFEIDPDFADVKTLVDAHRNAPECRIDTD